MPRVIFIDVVGALSALLVWHFCFARYNHRKALQVLQWVRSACAERGQVTKIAWAGSGRLFAELRFPPHVFEHARVVVSLLPRPLPLNWAICRWRKQKETLSFEADLYVAPRFQLEVHNHRWSGHSGSVAPGDWIISRPGPIVLTGRSKWNNELSPVIHTLISSRDRHFATVRFSPKSPHFSATLELDTLEEHPADGRWLEALRELAAGSSTSRQ